MEARVHLSLVAVDVAALLVDNPDLLVASRKSDRVTSASSLSPVAVVPSVDVTSSVDAGEGTLLVHRDVSGSAGELSPGSMETIADVHVASSIHATNVTVLANGDLDGGTIDLIPLEAIPVVNVTTSIGSKDIVVGADSEGVNSAFNLLPVVTSPAVRGTSAVQAPHGTIPANTDFLRGTFDLLPVTVVEAEDVIGAVDTPHVRASTRDLDEATRDLLPIVATVLVVSFVGSAVSIDVVALAVHDPNVLVAATEGDPSGLTVALMPVTILPGVDDTRSIHNRELTLLVNGNLNGITGDLSPWGVEAIADVDVAS